MIESLDSAKGQPQNDVKRVAFHTLGCKLNFSETSTIARDLLDRGFSRVDFSDVADLYVINTCSVTREADRKCRKAIRQAVRRSPDAFVAVTGCYAQLKPDEIARMPGVDLVLGVEEKLDLPGHLNSLRKKPTAEIYGCETRDIESFQPASSMGDRTRSFLKVQDGCDYTCSYCTIPLARGRSRSDSIESTVRSAGRIAENGVKEIVLSGVNVGDFGRNNGDTFLDLIKELDTIENLERIRISSIEPNLLSNVIIEFVANSRRFVPHFHIPLQSGSNKILGLMRRRYTKELYSQRVKMIKTLMPGSCIGADVMVGFPGETWNDFLNSFRFLKNLDVSYLHVFTYSERDMTDAIELSGSVPQRERIRRSRRLRLLSKEKRTIFYNHHVGQSAIVLFESYRNGILSGWTDNYVRTHVRGPRSLQGFLAQVRLMSNEGEYVEGELLN
ncbi:MAG: tRNA (N(6)-L-threonylcarbamoyladenosine(37)-C(2))-methylthiotransferase MtaB [Candidatus Neomarinimicrobiota bacterium]